jgi:hypothetical protein
VSKDTKISTLIAYAKSITRLSRLEGISHLFTKISYALQGLRTQKISNFIKPPLDKAVFLIHKKERQLEFNNLFTLGDNKSWFIANSNHLSNKFCRVVPLLAFKVADVQQISKLF